MKKRVLIIIIIVLVLILLIPIPAKLKDGGSVEYCAILYTVKKYHQLNVNPETGEMQYVDGIGIKILGIEIYNSTSEKEDNKTDNNLENKESSFFGKVIDSNSSYIIVEPNENEEERRSSDKFSISLGKNNDAIYEIGTNVKITYTGQIKETYPAQIDAVNIEIKSTDNFEIVFYDKKPQTVSKVNKILDKSETDRYDYNVYSYEGSANIIIEGETLTLKDALVNNKITMDEIIAKANNDLTNEKITGDMYKDGGSMIYKYGTYTIIKCHTLNGNRDVYIGIPEMTLNDVI